MGLSTTDSPAETLHPKNHQLIITFTCKDIPGIVHAISSVIATSGGNITESQQFASSDTGRFFMRVQIESPLDRKSFERCLQPVVRRFNIQAHVDSVGRNMRALVLASRSGHCLNELLFRVQADQIPLEIPLVLSNHTSLTELCKFYNIPFTHAPTGSPEEKADFENFILQAINENAIELVILARYMQILSPELCQELQGKAINIHHSFLPGFKGANPYLQAHTRGVKLIGATAHFVTSDLDEGPIIEQNVVRVDHGYSVQELRELGQNEESRTLLQAVKWFAEHRILLDAHRTVIFR